MKTNTFIGCAAMLLVVVYALVLNINPDNSSNMARFISNDALIYFEQHDGTKWFNRIAASHLGDKIRSIDIVSTGNKIGLSKDMIKKINHILSSINKANKLGIIDELFGDKLSVALLPPLDIIPKQNLLDFLRSNVIVVTKCTIA